MLKLDADFILEDNISKDRFVLTENMKIGFKAGAYDSKLPRFTLLVNKRTNLDDQLQQAVFTYPNPFNNYIYVNALEGFSEEVELLVLTSTGNQEFATNCIIEKNTAKYIALPNLSPGNYFIKMIDKYGKTSVQKLIKQ